MYVLAEENISYIATKKPRPDPARPLAKGIL